jgi:hypothetical protein
MYAEKIQTSFFFSDSDIQIDVIFSMLFQFGIQERMRLNIYARPSFFMKKIGIAQLFSMICSDIYSKSVFFLSR